MKAFVTGSTGLVGTNLVRLLVEQGHEVKALVRSAEKARRILPTQGVTLVEGDIKNIAGFAAQMRGCDVVFHVAAYFREYYQRGDHWATLKAINIAGTIQLLEQAEQMGVQKVIYVSSGGTIGKRADGQPSDENTPPSDYNLSNLYFRSKWESEIAIAEFLKTHKLAVVTVLPGWIYGPYDSGPTTAGRLVQDFLAGKLPAIIPGGSTMVDARDVAQGMINAVEYGRSGERYALTGEFHTIEELILTLAKVSNVPAPRLRMPYPILINYARLSELIARLRNTATLITVAGIKTLQRQPTVNSAKAQRELKISFRPLEETLRDEVNYFRAHTIQPATSIPSPAV